MAIVVKNEKVVVVGGTVATSTDCCCEDACCKCDDTCDNTVTKEECEADGGTWKEGRKCSDDPSPCDEVPKGGCCKDGECSIKTQACCEHDGGTYQGDDTACEDIDCTQGACCKDDACTIKSKEDCLADGGDYKGDGTTCEGVDCVRPPCEGCAHLYSAFDGSGRKFKKLTQITTGFQSWNIPGIGQVWEINWNATRTEDCGDCTSCVGSGTIHIESPGNPDLDCDITTNGCGLDCPDGCCAWPSGTTGCLWQSSPDFCIGNYTISCMGNCCGGFGGYTCCPEESVGSATTRTISYDCADGESPCHVVNVAIVQILSDECVEEMSPP